MTSSQSLEPQFIWEPPLISSFPYKLHHDAVIRGGSDMRSLYAYPIRFGSWPQVKMLAVSCTPSDPPLSNDGRRHCFPRSRLFLGFGLISSYEARELNGTRTICGPRSTPSLTWGCTLGRIKSMRILLGETAPTLAW